MRNQIRAFTTIELLIAVALVGVILALAAPSFQQMIVIQRLKGSSAQLLTDLQYARSEAVARRKNVHVHVKVATDESPISCYTIYTDTADVARRCNCQLAPGSACSAHPTVTELRTVQIPADGGIRLRANTQPHLYFDFITGGLPTGFDDDGNVMVQSFSVDAYVFVDGTRRLTTRVSPAGRPQVCLPEGARVSGNYERCLELDSR